MFSRSRLIQVTVFLIVLLALVAVFYGLSGPAPAVTRWAGPALGGVLLVLGLAAVLLALAPRGGGQGGGASGAVTPRNDRLLLFGIVVMVIALLMLLQDLLFSH